MLVVLQSSAVVGADSFRLSATVPEGPLLLVGRYQVSKPPYCLARRPSYGAKNYGRWLDPRCTPYTVLRASFVVSVRHNGERGLADSFRIDGAFGDPTRGGTFTPYYLYCGLLASASHTNPSGTYFWTVRLVDPFHQPGYDVVRHGAYRCGVPTAPATSTASR